jgi:hypothetical protein
MLTDIGQYLWDLAYNGPAFMTGGFLAALVLVIERLRRHLSARVFVIVFLSLGFIAASFQTWRHEHIAKLALEQVAQKRRNPAVLQHLQDDYADAAAYFLSARDAQSDAEFDDIKKSVDDWTATLGHWIIDNMGNGAYIKLIQPPSPLPQLNVKPGRADTLLLLMVLRDNLEKLVENPAWDRPTDGAQVAKPVTSP